MKIFRTVTMIILVISQAGQLLSQEMLLLNIYNRSYHSLNGAWSYIVDPYENGFYDYSYEAFDKLIKPGKSAYFMDADFRSPRRVLPNIQDGWNRKGLISESGKKKKAFFILKNFNDKNKRI